METHHKAIAAIGLAQILTEYIEELMSNPQYSTLFVRELKRDANNFIKSSDRFISYVSGGKDMDTKEQVVDVYKVISRLIEERIDWEMADKV